MTLRLPTGSSWRAAALVSDEARERLCDRTPVPDSDGFGEVEGAPVFIGHGVELMRVPPVRCA